MIPMHIGIIASSSKEEGKGALYYGNDLESKDSTTHFIGSTGD
jgi:hypothetical protein